MVRMPSSQEAAPAPSPLLHDTAPAGAPASPAQLLSQASRALWSATLSLMTAYMQHQAPAHRLLLARRIARNLDTLARQECFTSGCRATFGRLALRWQGLADQLAPERPQRLPALLRLFS
jgi:hypothetical protein